MRRYSHAFRVLMDQELFNLLAEASTKTGIPKSRFVRYAIQPFSYTELAPGTTDWNDVYRTDPDPEHPLKRGRQLNVMLTGDEYEMLCRAAFKLGIARSAWVRERVYALLCRSYADELSPLTDASIRDNDDAAQGAQDEGCGKMTFQKKEEPLPIRGRRHHPERSSTLMRFPMRSYGYVHGHPHGHVYGHPHGYVHGHPHGDAHQIEGKQARRFMYMNRARSLPRPTALKQQPECRRPMRKESE